MRMLVACPNCRRQFNATGQRPGTRLRCHCGGEVVVREATGHEARVVRCSGCGAPREENATACGYCGADFTIHETDLETVCPACLALVSDAARFCHCCGTPLAPETTDMAESLHECPVCGPEKMLRSRRLGEMQLGVLECQVCAGLWLSLAVFAHLLSDVQDQLDDSVFATPSTTAPPGRMRYRPCVVCGQLMSRRHVGRISQVIVDVCGAHGLWFDAGELAQLLAWMRSGGLAEVRAEFSHLTGVPRALRRQLQLEVPPARRPASGRAPANSPFETPGDDETALATIVWAALERLFKL